MTSSDPIWVTDLRADAERENRIHLALLRGVVETLKANRVVVPIFGLAICAIFQQWVNLGHLVCWYIQMLLGLIPQIVALSRFPQSALTGEDLRIWTRRVATANLFFVANWASLGFWLWSGGDKNSDHIVIELLLAATLAAHAASTGPCRAISRLALWFYLAVMVAVPLQGIFIPEAYARYAAMAGSAPLYVGFMALLVQ